MPTHLKELASLGGVVKCRRRNGQQQWRAHMKSLDGYGPRRLRKEDASGDLTRMRAAPTRADVLRIVAELRAEAMPAMIQSAKVSSTGSETRAKPRMLLRSTTFSLDRTYAHSPLYGISECSDDESYTDVDELYTGTPRSAATDRPAAAPAKEEAPRRKAMRTKYLPSSSSEEVVPLNEQYSSQSD